MYCENSEINGRSGKPPPPGSGPSPGSGQETNCQPRPEPEPEIDLERLVWDPEYRERMRRRLKRLG
jgi:hypothetical protein